MAEELRPCPFCGSHATSYGTRKMKAGGPTHCLIHCDECSARLSAETEDEAVAACNRRAERTCRVGCYPPGYEDNLHYEVCSECGTILTASRPGDRHAARASYCPSCGARVIEEASDDADR